MPTNPYLRGLLSIHIVEKLKDAIEMAMATGGFEYAEKRRKLPKIISMKKGHQEIQAIFKKSTPAE